MNAMEPIFQQYNIYLKSVMVSSMLIEHGHFRSPSCVTAETAQQLLEASYAEGGLVDREIAGVLDVACEQFGIPNNEGKFKALSLALIGKLYADQPRAGRPSGWDPLRLLRLSHTVDHMVKEEEIDTTEACKRLAKTDDWKSSPGIHHHGDPAQTLRRYYQKGKQIQAILDKTVVDGTNTAMDENPDNDGSM